MQLPLNVSPVSASFVGLERLGILLVLSVACTLLLLPLSPPPLLPPPLRLLRGGTSIHAPGLSLAMRAWWWLMFVYVCLLAGSHPQTRACASLGGPPRALLCFSLALGGPPREAQARVCGW